MYAMYARRFVHTDIHTYIELVDIQSPMHLIHTYAHISRNLKNKNMPEVCGILLKKTVYINMRLQTFTHKPT
jgi:hypothetical protein